MIRLLKGDAPAVLVANKDAWTAEFVAGDDRRRYAHPEIKDALRAETNQKCAYCESRMEHVSYPNVEHMRPKARFPDQVVEWTNLTLGCTVCNTNKGDHYDEDCVLLDPYSDAPEDHLTWFGPMVLEVTPDRGRSTITKIGLNRPELLYQRSERIRRAKDLITMIEGATPAVAAALRQDLKAMMLNQAEYSAAVIRWVETESPGSTLAAF